MPVQESQRGENGAVDRGEAIQPNASFSIEFRHHSISLGTQCQVWLKSVYSRSHSTRYTELFQFRFAPSRRSILSRHNSGSNKKPLLKGNINNWLLNCQSFYPILQRLTGRKGSRLNPIREKVKNTFWRKRAFSFSLKALLMGGRGHTDVIGNSGDIHDKFCQGENGDFPQLPELPPVASC